MNGPTGDAQQKMIIAKRMSNINRIKVKKYLRE